MLHELKKPAMRPVPQPSRHLARAHWNSLEIQLRAASRVAAEQQAAHQKREVAL
jgi:hypothetical protein